MPPRQLRLPIKCHVILGLLNSGKTSVILQALRCKPEDELWAILVNEAGAVGIDQALLAGAAAGSGTSTDACGAVIKELAGGCLCCALSTVTSAALVQLIRRTKPDRVIIEPSGLAHPKALLDMLHGHHLKTALDLQPICCLVDLSTFSNTLSHILNEEHTERGDTNDNFRAQIRVADVLIGTKADVCCKEDRAEFLSWAAGLEPPKQRILTCKVSELKLTDVGMQVSDSAASGAGMEAAAGTAEEAHAQLPAVLCRPVEKRPVWLSNADVEQHDDSEQKPSSRQPIRKETAGPLSRPTTTCGWVFHCDDVFDPAALEKFIREASPHVLRLKGIFRVQNYPPRWVSVSVGTDVGKYSGEMKELVSGKLVNDGGMAASERLQKLEGRYSDSRVEFIIGAYHAGNNTLARDEGVELGKAFQEREWLVVEKELLSLVVS